MRTLTLLTLSLLSMNNQRPDHVPRWEAGKVYTQGPNGTLLVKAQLYDQNLCHYPTPDGSGNVVEFDCGCTKKTCHFEWVVVDGPRMMDVGAEISKSVE